MRDKKANNTEECYLLPSDIEDIINEFSELERQIKAQELNCTESYLEILTDAVERAVKTRMREVSRQRQTEKIKEQATADAKNGYQTPVYYRPLRRLFRKTPNRAMQLIVEQEELIARIMHLGQQINNDALRRQAERQEEAYVQATSPVNDSQTPSEEATSLPVKKSRGN